MPPDTQVNPHVRPNQPPESYTGTISNQCSTKTRRDSARNKPKHLLYVLPLVLMTSPATAQFLHPRDTTVPLRVTNHCPETIWPAILTQSGIGPNSSGFELDPGSTSAQTVSGDWRGRVWGRTNCSFPSAGGAPASGQGGVACSTGDCGMFLECQGSVCWSCLRHMF